MFILRKEIFIGFQVNSILPLNGRYALRQLFCPPNGDAYKGHHQDYRDYDWLCHYSSLGLK